MWNRACIGKLVVSGADGSELGETSLLADETLVERSVLHAVSWLGSETTFV